MFYLRFVSSSAPTLKSALHFCKGHMYYETYSKGKNAIICRKTFISFHNCYTWKYVAFIEPALLIEPAMEKSLPAYLRVKV